MTISDNSAEARLPGTTAVIDAWPMPMRAIAPWWHTAILIATLLGTSFLTTFNSRTDDFGRSHIRHYAFTIAWEVVLALVAWWGIRMRGVPLRQLLGERRPGIRAWFTDFGIALIFWLMAMIILAALATVLRLLHLMHVQKAVVALAPASALEALLWVALSVTAGIVEEIVFRGYLLQQFASLTGKLWVGVLVSSLFFGASHGYEGIGGMIAITAYGALFCILAVKRRSLRAGMMAHAWHDSITGIAVAIAKHLHAI